MRNIKDIDGNILMSSVKVHDSKGNLYAPCPFLERIEQILHESREQNRSISQEELFEICHHFNSIRTIDHYLRDGNDFNDMDLEQIRRSYNITTIFKNIRLELQNGKLTDERLTYWINLYM